MKHILYHGHIVARYVRFVAGNKYGQACLRTEIFGAPRRDIKGLYNWIAGGFRHTRRVAWSFFQVRTSTYDLET